MFPRDATDMEMQVRTDICQSLVVPVSEEQVLCKVEDSSPEKLMLNSIGS